MFDVECDHDYESTYCDDCGKFCGMVCNHCGDWYDGGDHMASDDSVWCVCIPPIEEREDSY